MRGWYTAELRNVQYFVCSMDLMNGRRKTTENVIGEHENVIDSRVESHAH